MQILLKDIRASQLFLLIETKKVLKLGAKKINWEFVQVVHAQYILTAFEFIRTWYSVKLEKV